MSDSIAKSSSLAAQLNASGVTQRCVSLAYGALSPDLRVNYEYGLVLGVDEFRQEQLYHLQKSYQHNRALHGYGTVYGLKVTLEASAGDVLVHVGPGMAIDQYGRAILVRHEQCARLKAWLQKENRPASNANQSLCVTLRYDECTDMLKPIAGQPCSSMEASQAPARLRDSFNIQFQAEPPAMPAWDALQRFSRLMADVEIVPGAPSDLDTILRLVRLLDTPTQYDALIQSMRQADVFNYLIGRELTEIRTDGVAAILSRAVRRKVPAVMNKPVVSNILAGGGLQVVGGQTGSGQTTGGELDQTIPGYTRRILRLPAETARADLDTIFTTWAVEVRPNIAPNLSDPSVGPDGVPGAQPIAADVLLACIHYRYDGNQVTLVEEDADYEGRPYLLHTQLIQEMLLLGGSKEPPREFATLQVRGSHVLRAWIHHPDALQFGPNALRLLREGTAVAIQEVVVVPGVSNCFDLITAPGEANAIGGGSRLELTFLLENFTTGPAPWTMYEYNGYRRETGTLRLFVLAGTEPRELAALQVRGGGVCHLWIYYPAAIEVPGDAVGLRVNGQPLPVSSVERVPGAFNVFKVDTADTPNLIPPGARVECWIMLDRLHLSGNGNPPLLPGLDQLGYNLVGRERDNLVITALAPRIQATREFVSLQTIVDQENNLQVSLELWFHPNREGLVSLPVDTQAPPAFKLWSQSHNRLVNYRLFPIAPRLIGGRQYAARWRVMPVEGNFEDGELLALSFYTDRVLVAQPNMSLTRLITQEQMAFIGYNGNRWLRVYYQVDAPPPPPVVEPDGVTIEQVRQEATTLIAEALREALHRQPSLPFVTITPVENTELPTFELWFHLAVNPDQAGRRIDARMLAEFMRVYAEVDNERTPFRVQVDLEKLVDPGSSPHFNVFIVTLDPRSWAASKQSPLLRVVFFTQMQLMNINAEPLGSLAEYIRETGVKFTGFTPYFSEDPDDITRARAREAIVAYVRMPEGRPQ